MVAVIHGSSSLNRALNYNEQKVKTGDAFCLTVSNYPKDADQLTYYQKLNRLKNQAALNNRTRVNSVHISLNFSPKEKLQDEKLKEISESYMYKIGFGQQPYLVYKHLDAGHPHLHIVTTNIKRDGKRIELHNLGKNESEKARKEIEIEFALVKARKQTENFQINSFNLLRVQYGKSETKRSITNVLLVVLNSFKYSSLPELNVVLKLFNVVADRGAESSRTFIKEGLLYRILDENGNRVGVPIKSSLIHNKPTLKYLKEKFDIHKKAKQFHRERLKTVIDKTILKFKDPTIQEVIRGLKNQSIHVELRENKEGLLYGITYVDLYSKCVFNGSDLGKSYTAKGLQQRCCKSDSRDNVEIEVPKRIQGPCGSITAKENLIQKLVNVLVEPVSNYNYIPFPLKSTKKKKKKRMSI